MATKMVDGVEVATTKADLDQMEADRLAQLARPPQRPPVAMVLERLTPTQIRKLFVAAGADWDSIAGG